MFKLFDHVANTVTKSMNNALYCGTGYQRLFRVTNNTVSGNYVSHNNQAILSEAVNYFDGEKIELLYLYDDGFDQDIDLSSAILIGITNYRIFKIDKGVKTYTLRKNIINIRHVKRGVFVWDSLQCKTDIGIVVTYGIYHTTACDYFCNHLRTAKWDDPVVYISTKNAAEKYKRMKRQNIAKAPKAYEPIIFPTKSTVKVEPKVEPQVESKIETPVEPKVEPQVESKIETPVEPKVEPPVELILIESHEELSIPSAPPLNIPEHLEIPIAPPLEITEVPIYKPDPIIKEIIDNIIDQTMEDVEWEVIDK
jgi:hypothetical protein